MKRKVIAVLIGLAMSLVVLVLLFPLGCFDSDGLPGTVGRQRGGCPRNLTHIGFEWPNGIIGLFGAFLTAVVVGGLVGAFAWRRLVPSVQSDMGSSRE